MPDQIKPEDAHLIQDDVDRTIPWWRTEIRIAGPTFTDVVVVESNDQLEVLPSEPDGLGIKEFEQYGKPEGRVQVRKECVMHRTTMLIKPLTEEEPEGAEPSTTL